MTHRGRSTVTKYTVDLLSYEWPPVAHALGSNVGEGKTSREVHFLVLAIQFFIKFQSYFRSRTSALVGKGLDREAVNDQA